MESSNRRTIVGVSGFFHSNGNKLFAKYWKTDKIYHYSPVANRISRDRFMDIARYIHFIDNSTLPARTDQKVQPLIDAVLAACTSTFDPGNNVSVDQAMSAFKGRSSIKQYMCKR